MTAFVVTLTPDFATVTTDSLARFADGRIGTVDKIRALPTHGAILAGAGSLGALVDWGTQLSVGMVGRDIREIVANAPARLVEMWGAFPSEVVGDGFRVVHVGWAGDGPVGALHVFPDFEARALSIGRGHLMQPTVDSTAPGYDQIEARWAPAAAGREVTAFHLAVLRNQRWALDHGRVPGLGPGVVIGGPLIRARIDAGGIHMRRIGELPGM
jgi:hypothetical protein